MNVGAMVMYVFLILFGIVLFVYLQQYMIGLSTVGWTFAGHTFVAALLPIMPTLFLLMLIIIPIYFIIQEVHQ